MKVNELIQLFQQYDPEMEIQVWVDTGVTGPQGTTGEYDIKSIQNYNNRILIVPNTDYPKRPNKTW